MLWFIIVGWWLGLVLVVRFGFLLVRLGLVLVGFIVRLV